MENNSSVLSLMLSSLGWILLVIMTAVFFFFGQNYYYQRGVEDGRAVQLQEDIAKVDQQLGGAITSGPSTQISAIVKEIEGNRIRVNAINQTPNPLGSSDFVEERTIVITSETQVVRQIPKDPEVYAQEIDVARANSQEGEVVTLQPFTEEVVSVDALEVEQTIVVQAQSQEDLSAMTEITAGLIYLLDDQLVQ